MMTTHPKQKRCPICDLMFTPWMTTQHVCSNYQCAIAWNRKQDERYRIRAERRRQRAGLPFKQKERREFLKEAQEAFNKYIRVRDAGRPCHACGCVLNDNNPDRPGAFVDASHFRSRARASQLRFNVFNCVTSCVHCNRDLSGNIPNLRRGLIDRFGLSIVIRLECDNTFKPYTISYLVRLKEIFSRRTEHLIRLRAGKEAL
ncbi:hypothetical protein C1Y41_04400 [Pantoea sp. ICBG 1758]|uniref:recombination protein NinG n=1 Tax=Pantoea sp. ICBG 1758 TaxID=2071682 RepID=UPI000CE376BA|nr:recombination protein NinG [Pantoea sp. ICBG 1758]PPC63891.1 hypothetical protein C1Y41_04400 [Pantoea sp. ICBG 1758]